jgi:putative endonuclease
VSKENISLGRVAEDKAVEFLKSNGYKIIERNYKNKLGEIDIVAKDRDTVCFVEVKCRSSNRFGLAVEAVSGAKQRQISRAALVFLKSRNLLDAKARFDVVALEGAAGFDKINLIKSAFEWGGDF